MYTFCEQNPKIPCQGLFETSSVAKHKLGTVIELADGRKFAYAKAGASNLVQGNLLQGPIPQANHLNKTVNVTAAAGATSLTVDVVTTAITDSMYDEGFVNLNDAAGEGHVYKIRKTNAGGASSTSKLDLYDELLVGVTAATSEYTLIKHPYDGVIQCPTTLTSIPVGVAPFIVTAAYYFWMPVRGPVSILTNGTIVIGNQVGPSGSVAGAVAAMGVDDIKGQVGTVLTVNADTEHSVIMLMLG